MTYNLVRIMDDLDDEEQAYLIHLLHQHGHTQIHLGNLAFVSQELMYGIIRRRSREITKKTTKNVVKLKDPLNALKYTKPDEPLKKPEYEYDTIEIDNPEFEIYEKVNKKIGALWYSRWGYHGSGAFLGLIGVWDGTTKA